MCQLNSFQLLIYRYSIYSFYVFITVYTVLVGYFPLEQSFPRFFTSVFTQMTTQINAPFIFASGRSSPRFPSRRGRPRNNNSNNRIFRLGFHSNEETRKRKMTFYWIGGVPIVYCALTIIGYASLLCVSWSNCHLGRGFICHGNILPCDTTG